eukprot:6399638-Amphidinium_carterae.1
MFAAHWASRLHAGIASVPEVWEEDRYGHRAIGRHVTHASCGARARTIPSPVQWLPRDTGDYLRAWKGESFEICNATTWWGCGLEFVIPRYPPSRASLNLALQGAASHLKQGGPIWLYGVHEEGAAKGVGALNCEATGLFTRARLASEA